jgi:transposase-like protein
VVARWEASGQSCRAFCATHGVEVKRLYRWRRRLRPRPAADPPPGGFVLAVASPGVRVRLAGGALIEVDPGFDGHLLRQVVAALC